jgi:hypothetical protein
MGVGTIRPSLKSREKFGIAAVPPAADVSPGFLCPFAILLRNNKPAVSAFNLTRFLPNFLWNFSPTDPVVFAAIVIDLFLTSIVARLVPTFRAMPATALRYK